MALQRDIGKIQPVIVEPVSQVDVDPVDLSTAQNIRRIGGAAIQIGTNIYGNQLKDEIENDISEYVNSEAVHVDGVNRLADASLNQALLTEQTGVFADPSTEDIGEADPLVEEARADVTRLSNAVASGVMSQSQLKIRVQQKMRQYINSAPGLSAHFRNIYAQTMGDYSAVLKATHDKNVAQQKAVGAERKAWTKQGDKLFVDPALQSDWPRYQAAVSTASKAKRDSIDVINEAASLTHDQNKQRITVRKNLPSLIDNSFLEFRGMASAALANPNLKKAEKKQIIQDIKQQYQGLIMSQGTVAKAYGGAEVNTLMAHKISRLDQYIAAVDNVETAKSLEAQLEYDKAQHETKLYENFPELRDMETLSNKLGITANIQNIPGGVGAYASFMSGLSGGDIFNTGGLAPQPKSQEESDVLSGYYMMSKDFLSKYEVNDTIPPNTLVGLYEGPMRRWDAAQLPNDKEIDGYFDFIASKDGLKGLQLIEASGETLSRSEMEFTMDGFIKTRWIPSLAKTMNTTVSQTGEGDIDSVGDFVDIKLNPTTGAMTFVRNTEQVEGEEFDPFVTKQIRYLNKEIARRYNNIIRSKAHLSNPNSPNYLEASKALFVDLSLERQK